MNRAKYILFLLVAMFFSCRKVKMKDEKDILVGTWKLNSVCGELGCSSPSSALEITLIVRKNGIFELSEIGKKTEEARIVKMKLTTDEGVPNPIPPQINYYYEVKIKKRNWFSKSDILTSYRSIRYSNGGYDINGNFISDEGLHLFREVNGMLIGAMFFIRN